MDTSADGQHLIERQRTAAMWLYQADWYRMMHLAGNGLPVPADLAWRIIDRLPGEMLSELSWAAAYKSVPGPET